MKTKKYRPLPASTRLIVEFHNGIHSFYCTKGDIIKRRAFHTPAMSGAAITALFTLECDRQVMWGKSEVANAIGTCRGHMFTLEIAEYRIGAIA